MTEEERSKLLANVLLDLAHEAELDCYLFIGIQVVENEPKLKLAVTSLGNRRDAIENMEAIRTVSHQNVDEVLRLMFPKDKKPEKGLMN